ncbi:MAG: hypothetical protein M1337_04535 [Actinobacteria bacterium]|nr:hypothetical protein [Actinomycetota bacterium]
MNTPKNFRRVTHDWTWPAALSICALTVAVIVAALAVFRLQLSINLNDEPFYSTLPYRFILGDRPFIDDVSYIQMFAFLTYPLVRLFVAVRGNATGIILFMRCAYLALVVVTGCVAFRYVRRRIRWQYALLVAVLPLMFAPWNIQSLSYNTMGAALLTIGLFEVLRAVDCRWKVPMMIGAGAVLGLTIVAYPTMVIPVGFLVGGLHLWARQRRPRAALWCLIGLSVVLLPLAVFLWRVGAHNLVASYHISQSGMTQGGGLAKLAALLAGSRRTLYAEPALIAVFAILGLTRGRQDLWPSRARLGAYLLVPLAVAPLAAYPPLTRTSGLFVCLSLIGLFIRLFDREAVGPREFALVFLPSLLAGALTGYSSNNGYLNFGVGLLPAATISLVWLCNAVEAAAREARLSTAARQLAPVVPIAGVLLLMVVFQYRAFYNDAPLGGLTQRIASGPFQGIKTSPQSAALVTDMERDVRRLSRPGDRILFFDDLPAGYLMTSLRPAANTTWSPSPYYVPGADASALLRYYERQHVRPSIVVQYLVDTPYQPNHPIVRFLHSGGYQLVLSDDRYSIFRLRSP